MQAVTTIGFDIAKSVFQVHGVDTVGQVIIRRQLKLVGIEACASSHHWTHPAADAIELCEALRQTAEERCH